MIEDGTYRARIDELDYHNDDDREDIIAHCRLLDGRRWDIRLPMPKRGPGRHLAHEFLRSMTDRMDVDSKLKARDYPGAIYLLRLEDKWFQMLYDVRQTTDKGGYHRYIVVDRYSGDTRVVR